MKITRLIVLILAAFTGMFILCPIAGFVHDASAGVVVICNKNVPVDSLDKKEIKKIYLGDKTRWSDDKKIIFVALDSGEEHKTFLKKYVGKSSSQFRNYWKKKVFTGKGKAPKSFRQMEGLLEYVAGTEGAIGYISSELTDDNVKIISEN